MSIQNYWNTGHFSVWMVYFDRSTSIHSYSHYFSIFEMIFFCILRQPSSDLKWHQIKKTYNICHMCSLEQYYTNAFNYRRLNFEIGRTLDPFLYLNAVLNYFMIYEVISIFVLSEYNWIYWTKIWLCVEHCSLNNPIWQK